MIAITGASGQLGRLVIQSLLARNIAATQIVAAVRDPSKVADLAALGVVVRQADYSRPDTLTAAFAGVDRLLLISSNELGQRAMQHRAVIDAARTAGVKLLAYTSVLHADSSPLGLAEEHRSTEAAIAASGLPFVLLRNGWYTENYAASIPQALQHGALLGSAGNGRIASAARADFAEAAAVVLTTDGHEGRVLELAGDTSYTLAEFAAQIARAAGKPVAYSDMPQADFKAVLLQVGLPEGLAELLSDSDAAAAQGALADESKTLSRLIGRPTTPWQDTVATTVQAS
ncbi:SDR family oxidoreductase [Xylophilus sp. GOD-11R]|uniref:SDR family oxidoreductase n=1 Tax=Xylophilus sp. GOD-11R TaxID=3089814 RepID=UPI00298BDD6E|nr:SDR family oxidoreductase [Xylophilus sp. GOD-11R]WPB59027.1 SDR family oxidoreductase [Xylophilus sp. GOD-11R]